MGRGHDRASRRGPAGQGGRRDLRGDRTRRGGAFGALPAFCRRLQRDTGQTDRAMNLDDLPPAEVMWAGKYVRILKRDRWEYASRTNNIGAVVILAEHDGKTILIDQPRVPPDCRCIELPAGLVGDEDPNETLESTAIKELEQETGFTAERIERLGYFYASPGMVSEGFTLVRAHAVRRIGGGGGDETEAIKVHLVPRSEIPNFIEQKRAEGFGVDVKLLLFLSY